MAAIALSASTPSLSATMEPLYHVDGSPKLDWENVPDITFDCESGEKLRLSHRNNSLIIDGKRVGGISQTDAMYTQVVARDRFGNDSIATVIFLQLVKGPAGGPTAEPWEIADASGSPMADISYGGVWYFWRGRNVTKCIPASAE